MSRTVLKRIMWVALALRLCSYSLTHLSNRAAKQKSKLNPRTPFLYTTPMSTTVESLNIPCLRKQADLHLSKYKYKTPLNVY